MKELEVLLQTLQSERQQLAEDDQEMIRQRAKLEFDVKDLEESLVDDKKSKVSRLKSLVVGVLMCVCVDVCRRAVRKS